MNKKRRAIINSNEISEIKSFKLNGHDQKVLIEGKHSNLPIVISLHGGPGAPIPFSVGCRGMFPNFTDSFIMVYWDQYGCGINNSVIDDSFTIDMFVKMSSDLIREIKNLYPNNKIYIFSISWGSILSTKLLEKDNHLVDGVVAWGQIIKNVFYNQEVYNELELNEKCKMYLEQIKKTDIRSITSKDLKLISNCLRKYTNAYNNKDGKQYSMIKFMMNLLTSPDYKLKDFKAIMVNGYIKNISLWKEILQLDLSNTLSTVNIPYIILQGDTDIIASTATVKKLVSDSLNPNLKCIVINNTGHYPTTTGMEVIQKELVELTSGKHTK